MSRARLGAGPGLLALLLCACEPVYDDAIGESDDTDPTHTDEPEPTLVPLLDDPVEVDVAEVFEGAVHGLLAGPGRVLVQRGDDTYLLDVREEAAHRYIGLSGELVCAAPVGEDVLAAVGEELWYLAHRARPSPLGELLPGSVASLQADGEGLWIGADTTVRWVDDRLQHIRLDDEPITGRVAPDAAHKRGRVTWVRHGEGLVALDAGLVAVDRVPSPIEGLPVQDFAADRSGTVWFVVDGVVHARPGQGGPVRSLEATSARTLLGASDAPVVWVQLASGAYVGDLDGLRPVRGLPAGTWSGVDSHGRLLVRTEQGPRRISVGPSVVVHDLPLILREPTRVQLEPGAPDPSTLRLSIDDQDIALDAQGSAVLQPASLPQDTPLQVRASAAWSDGRQAQWGATLTVSEGFPTWQDDVRPLAQARCVECHGEGGGEPALHTAEQWQSSFDAIWAAVSSERMPLTGEPLDQVDLDLLNAWRQGDFQ